MKIYYLQPDYEPSGPFFLSRELAEKYCEIYAKNNQSCSIEEEDTIEEIPKPSKYIARFSDLREEIEQQVTWMDYANEQESLRGGGGTWGDGKSIKGQYDKFAVGYGETPKEALEYAKKHYNLPKARG